jgi:hypothetical protein
MALVASNDLKSRYRYKMVLPSTGKQEEERTAKES